MEQQINQRFENYLIENRQVRIFLSSTFSDMQEERSELVKSFEILKVDAAKRNVSLSVVDLRWGVTEEEAKSGKVISVCLNEIENSHPFFIGILGNNYGTAPKRTELEKNPELKERYPWLDSVISDNEDESMSITEMEIQYGVLDISYDIDAAFFFKNNGKPDNSKRLTGLKGKIRERYTPNDYVTPRELCKKAAIEVRKIIDKHFPENEIVTALDRERIAQRAYINSRHSCYFERPFYFDIIDSFVQSDEQHLVFTGESGIGKSALLANWIKRNEKNPDFNLIYHFVGNSFSGNNYESILCHICDEIYDLYDIRKDDNLNEQIEKEAQRLVVEVSQKDKQLIIVIDGINQIVTQGPGREKLLLWLPSPSKNLKYIFSTLPDDETMETFNRRGYKIEMINPLSSEELKGWIPDYLKRVGKSLDKDKKQLERIVKWALSNVIQGNMLALKTLLDELICFGIHEKVDERINYYLLASSIPDFFDRVLQRMEEDYSADLDLVRHVLILLAVSEQGLSEDELLAIMGLQQRPLCWHLFFCAFYNHFVVRNGLITFSHKYVTDAVTTHYDLNESKSSDDYRREIISYFSLRQSENRSKSELAYQYYKLSDWDGLLGVLVDFGTFKYLNDTTPYHLGHYWKTLITVDKDKYSLSAYLRLSPVKDEELVLLLNDIALFILDIIADYPIALVFYNQALELCKEVYGMKHPMAAVLHNNIGNVYDHMEDFPNALKHYEMDLKLTKKIDGTLHPDTATSYNNIGEVYRKIGDLRKAKRYHTRALGIREKCFGIEHIETAQSYNNLGLVYYGMGNYKKALMFHLLCSKIYENALGEEHPDTANAYFSVGMDLEELGEISHAEEYYQKDLSINEKVLGKYHPYTADSYNNLGERYRKKGDYKSALEYHEQALEIRERIFGKWNSSTAQSYNNMGLVYLGQRDFDNAIKYITEALDIWKDIYGEYHHQVAICYNNIGMALDKQNNSEEALLNFQEALRIQKKILPKDHTDIALTYINLGSTLYESGKADDALDCLNKALAIDKVQLGKDHPITLEIINWIKIVTGET